jgi:hypothetical protein
MKIFRDTRAGLIALFLALLFVALAWPMLWAAAHGGIVP